MSYGPEIFASVVNASASGGHMFYGEATITVRTAGGSGTSIATGLIMCAAIDAAPQTKRVDAGSSLDTTGTNLVRVHAQWGTAHANNSCKLETFTVDVL